MTMYGRNGESPAPVIAPATPGDCFFVTYEACRIALKYMTPVFILSDAFLANGSEPWMIPSLGDLPSIQIKHAEARDGQYMPYESE